MLGRGLLLPIEPLCLAHARHLGLSSVDCFCLFVASCMAEQEVYSSTQATCEPRDRLSLQANHASCLLQVCADTLIGSDQVRGVSGGQRKRVTTGPAQPMHHALQQKRLLPAKTCTITACDACHAFHLRSTSEAEAC